MENQNAEPNKPPVPRPAPMKGLLVEPKSSDGSNDHVLLAIWLGAIALTVIAGLALRLMQ